MDKVLKIFLPILFTATHSFGQTSEWYSIEANGGLCSQSIVLFTDGTYNCERGCEASSHFSFGSWTQKKDTILFKEANSKKFKVIKDYTSKKTDNKNLSVKIFDNKGQNITDRISVGQYVKGKGTYNLDLDSTKTTRFDFKRDSGIIIIKSLQNLLGQRIEIQTDDSNYYEITLNVSKDWIYHSNSDWGGNGDFKLLKTKQGLSSLRPDSVDEKGNFIKTVFKQQL
jgi:hypothetical protein